MKALAIAATGMNAQQTNLEVIANNIANINTATSTDQDAFQAQMVMARPRSDGGVDVAGIALSDPEGRVVNDPDNALADADGNVRLPEVDLASQMSQLVMAQRGFQDSVQVTKNAQDTYNSALQIGRS
jgi:flagellar basal-body rod protein FlgC